MLDNKTAGCFDRQFGLLYPIVDAVIKSWFDLPSKKQGEGAMEPVIFPIEDVLDLHTFVPREIPDLLVDYLAACREKGIHEVRIIHGKGSGTLRKRVRSVLGKIAYVLAFEDAPLEAGGWGATIVTLSPV